MGREPILDMFIFETSQLLEQLEHVILESEKVGQLSSASINEIFRIMHTIKGSSAMMLFNGISKLTHSLEDVFFFIREQKPEDVDLVRLFDLVFKAVDFLKNEISKIEEDSEVNSESSFLVEEIQEFLLLLKSISNVPDLDTKAEQVNANKQRFYIGSADRRLYKAIISFDQGCEMENIRAFGVIHNLKDVAEVVEYYPADIIENEESVEIIRKEGFSVVFATELMLDEARERLNRTVFLKELIIIEISEDGEAKQKNRLIVK